jgi:uncharacterized membrane protein
MRPTDGRARLDPGGRHPAQAHPEQGVALPPAGAAAGRVPRRAIWPILVGIALVGLVLLLPDLTPVVQGGDSTVTAFHGRIVSIGTPSGESDPDSPPVTMAKVTYLEGPQAGQTLDAYLVGPGGAQSVADYKVGDEVVVTISDSPDTGTPFISVSDRWRLPVLGWLVALFAVAVVAVGGWHGVRALVALGLTIAVIVKVLLPLIIAGYPPVTLAVLTASGVTILTILITEGLKRSSLAAILGTTGALAITGLLAAAATAALGFTYIAGSDLAFFTLPDGRGLDLRGVLLAAMILGAVGVLDDVTVTQAVLVDELATAGRIEGTNLVMRAMTVGRSHIAATVNTLFLAYVGAGLPLLVVLLVSRQPAALVFNDEVIVTEIVRTLVGSLGIVAAIPLTTFIASALRGSAPRQAGWSESTSSRLSGVAVVSLIIVVLLLLTAALPITSGPRAPMTADRFDPSLLPGGNASSPLPTESNAPVASDAEITIVDVGEPTPITIDGADVGSVMVASWSFGTDASDRSIDVGVHYEATAPFSLRTGTWALLFPDGSEIALLPVDDPAALDRTLESGVQADVALGADGLPPQDPSVVYLDASTGDFIFGVPLT